MKILECEDFDCSNLLSMDEDTFTGFEWLVENLNNIYRTSEKDSDNAKKALDFIFLILDHDRVLHEKLDVLESITILGLDSN